MLLASTAARADVTLQILDIDPQSPAILDKWDKVYLRVAYTTDRKMQVIARGFLGGKPVPAMTSGAMPHDAGSGEAFYWIAYVDPRKVDTIVVEAVSGRTTYAKTSIPVDLTWTGVATSSPRVAAEWAERMQAEQNRHIEAETQAYMNRSPQFVETPVRDGDVLGRPRILHPAGLDAVAFSWRLAGGGVPATAPDVAGSRLHGVRLQSREQLVPDRADIHGAVGVRLFARDPVPAAEDG